MNKNDFEVIVIGGGHAGVEAAAAAARMGVKTLLLTQNIDTIGQMSCNPAIGGIGKSHLVKEVDALDGIMAKAIDKAGIQFRVLNSRKGAAVQATRAQADRLLYKQAVQELLLQTENVSILQATVNCLQIKDDVCRGVITAAGDEISANAVVLAVGTFLGGTIHIGDKQVSGGRAGDPASNALSKQLRQYNWPVGRLKTGTPPRIDVRSIDFSKLEKQDGDDASLCFSFLGSVADHPKQIPCHISKTTAECHAVIADNLKFSAMFSGSIEGNGPRYCPSIEDKISRFADRDSHLVFLEPEGLTSFEIYPNGVSTSLPFAVQKRFIKAMLGMENAWITRPGYAIEYDYFNPQALCSHLETSTVSGLFFCGQINGTTGYEEAAAQGLLAGINAALAVQGRDCWVVGRDQAYLGVMIDDLVTLGTQEPYRMFTSRAEYRLMLREDNADERLTPVGRELGVVSDYRWRVFSQKQKQKAEVKKVLDSIRFISDDFGSLAINANITTAEQLFKGVGLGVDELSKLGKLKGIDLGLLKYWHAEIKYAGYVARQKKEVARCGKNQQMRCQRPFDYSLITGLSAEMVEKLNQSQPENVGQASRIPGVTPAAISLVMVYFKKASELLNK